jgi:3-carboxy-cis,cis-muconate cycloisomerase
MAQALPGLQVDTARMLANLQALRAELPAAAADEWFSPSLVRHAAELTRTQLRALQESSPSRV